MKPEIGQGRYVFIFQTYLGPRPGAGSGPNRIELKRPRRRNRRAGSAINCPAGGTRRCGCPARIRLGPEEGKSDASLAFHAVAAGRRDEDFDAAIRLLEPIVNSPHDTIRRRWVIRFIAQIRDVVATKPASELSGWAGGFVRALGNAPSD